jgi:glucuronoarabinoxylan endo-1,4-beta-xylanase
MFVSRQNIVWKFRLALLLLLTVSAQAQQITDDSWTGYWTGTYSFIINPCGITNSGDISLTLYVTNGVVTGSGLQEGLACTDGNCGITGYGTSSGPVQGTTSNNAITFGGNWADSCNNQNYYVPFSGTLSGDVITGTGTGSIVLHRVRTNDCLVDWNTTYQEIDGFGAASAFVSSWSPAWADLFFSTNTGIGLSLLRSSIQPDGTAPESDLMQYAAALGVRVWCAPWTPPEADKDFPTLDGANFSSAYNQPYADQLASFVLNMKTNYGVDLYAISVQNEPDYITSAYQSCGWNGQQIHNFVPYLSLALSNNGVGSTKIMVAEESDWRFDLAAQTFSDPITSNMVSIIAAHDYSYICAQEYTGSLSLWETETSGFGGFDPSMTDGLFWADQIQSYMTVANANAFSWWWLIPEGGDNEGLTDVYGNPAKRMYVLGQFSRFIRPGYWRIGAFNNAQTSISAYKDPVAGNFAILAINSASTNSAQYFHLDNFTAGFVAPWITDSNLSLALQPAVPVTNGFFSYVLPAQSVVTFVGQTNLLATVLQQPQDQAIYSGKNASFSVGVSGAWPLSYAWQLNGSSIAGATNAAYVITNPPTSASGGQFACVVSNIYGTATSQVVNLTVSAPVCAPLLPSIMAWWPGGTAADVVGNNNGELVNGVEFTNAFAGTGFVFNGASNYLEIPPNLFPQPNDLPFSVELWFETTNGGVILAHEAASPFVVPSGGWQPDMYVGTNGTLYVQLFWDGAYNQITSSNAVNDGNYHHLAVTYDGTNEVAYLDGAIFGVKRLPYAATSYFPCQFGTGYTAGWPGANGGWFNFSGVIDQPAMYSNALTPAQVLSLYQAGSAGKCLSIPPVITAQPLNQTVEIGETASFSISATSLTPATFQWVEGATNLPNATNVAIQLTNVATAASGSKFVCVVSNAYGASTSSVVTLTVRLPQPCVPPPPGIVAWWPGNGNALDVVGGNNGLLMDGAGFANGLVAEGFAFDGITNYVQFPTNLFLFANGQPFTFELWFETYSGGVILGQQAALPFNYPGNGWTPEIYVGIDGNLRVQMFWNGTFAQISTTNPVNDGNFHHLAAIYDGTNQIVYLDGSLLGEEALPASSYTANFSCQLGAGYSQNWPEGNSGWYTFNGIIDEPTLYSNALTAAQVLSIYNANNGGKCTNELLPTIVTQPTNVTVPPGANVAFNISATSLLPLSYQWMNGAAPVSGATNISYSLTNVSLTNSGSQFTCVVSNTYAVSTSAVATLSVTNHVPVIQLTAPSLSGGNLHFTFALTGGSPATFVLLQASQLSGPWVTNFNAQLGTNTPGASYTFTVPVTGVEEFFRVQGP